MNNEQKAEDYAAKICEIYQSSVHDTRWLHDVVTEAVLHGIEIGYDMGFKDGLPPVEEDGEQAAKSLAEIKAVFGPHIHLEDDSNTPIKADWGKEHG